MVTHFFFFFFYMSCHGRKILDVGDCAVTMNFLVFPSYLLQGWYFASRVLVAPSCISENTGAPFVSSCVGYLAHFAVVVSVVCSP